MKKSTIITVAIIAGLLTWGIISLGKIGHTVEIQKLYENKGAIVTRKADLLQQDLMIRNEIDDLNKKIAEVDAKLYKLINPEQEGLNKESGITPIQQLNQAMQISGQD